MKTLLAFLVLSASVFSSALSDKIGSMNVGEWDTLLTVGLEDSLIDDYCTSHNSILSWSNRGIYLDSMILFTGRGAGCNGFSIVYDEPTNTWSKIDFDSLGPVRPVHGYQCNININGQYGFWDSDRYNPGFRLFDGESWSAPYPLQCVNKCWQDGVTTEYYNGKAYRILGESMITLDLSDTTWETIGSASGGQAHQIAFVLNDTLYSGGGDTWQPGGSQFVHDWNYMAADENIQPMANLQYDISTVGALAVGDVAYVVPPNDPVVLAFDGSAWTVIDSTPWGSGGANTIGVEFGGAVGFVHAPLFGDKEFWIYKYDGEPDTTTPPDSSEYTILGYGTWEHRITVSDTSCAAAIEQANIQAVLDGSGIDSLTLTEVCE